jgi:hypothetical protein
MTGREHDEGTADSFRAKDDDLRIENDVVRVGNHDARPTGDPPGELVVTVTDGG